MLKRRKRGRPPSAVKVKSYTYTRHGQRVTVKAHGRKKPRRS